ncbi:hypothetical protein TNIN_162141 [Trichonephila inaurata madagascariensis]|uniref:Uncharacterized protein n=1 Tax=Trichonephila inaurata madagascariensis TaxID=2747483 RepID=A0A8X6X045_9ARAC|nr:hypothetical protein TNIN_162141 [Trichonephila inaurata madagascariensis]
MDHWISVHRVHQGYEYRLHVGVDVDSRCRSESPAILNDSPQKQGFSLGSGKTWKKAGILYSSETNVLLPMHSIPKSCEIFQFVSVLKAALEKKNGGRMRKLT